MNTQQLLDEIHDKYGEWIELEGANGPLLVNQILAKMVLIERDTNEYYRKRLNHDSFEHTRSYLTGISRVA